VVVAQQTRHLMAPTQQLKANRLKVVVLSALWVSTVPHRLQFLVSALLVHTYLTREPILQTSVSSAHRANFALQQVYPPRMAIAMQAITVLWAQYLGPLSVATMTTTVPQAHCPCFHATLAITLLTRAVLLALFARLARPAAAHLLQMTAQMVITAMMTESSPVLQAPTWPHSQVSPRVRSA